MENMNISYKKWVATFVIVLVVIIGAILIGRYVSHKLKTAQNTTPPTPLVVVKKTLDNTQVPENIPQDLPKESSDQIFQNYVAKTEDGRVQGTRSYEIKNSLSDAYANFQTYFSQNGWKVTSKLDQSSLKSITAVKGQTQLQVNIVENSVTKIRTVNINATLTK
jgi:hypothetical protein